MKISEIEPGGAYLLRVTLPGIHGAGRIRTTKTVTVVDKAGRDVLVEAPEWVCTNAEQFEPGALSWAMVNGRLRYQQRPKQWTAKASDILRPAPNNTGGGDAGGGDVDEGEGCELDTAGVA